MGGSNLHHSNIGSLLGPFDYVGENIAMGSAGVSAGALHVAWMHSQEHRDNILSPGYQEVGIGVYCAPERLDLGHHRVRPTDDLGLAPGGLQRRHAAESGGPARRRLAHLRVAEPGQLQQAPRRRRPPARSPRRHARRRHVEREEVPHPRNRQRSHERARHRGEQERTRAA